VDGVVGAQKEIMLRRSTLYARATCVTLTLLAMLSSGGAVGADLAAYRSDRSFDETVQQLQWVFGGYGLTTVTALDYQQLLRGIKVPVGRAVIFEIMRLDWLKVLMTEDPALGIALPIRIQVYESAGPVTFVSYQSPGADLQANEKERVRALGRQIDEKLSALVRQATHVPQGNREQ
jgi:uncharacterized protein (DUF302 family)